jgi:hypothetical protein
MRRFVLEWKRRGLEERLGSRIVTYADDLVILCRRGRAEERQGRPISNHVSLSDDVAYPPRRLFEIKHQ